MHHLPVRYLIFLSVFFWEHGVAQNPHFEAITPNDGLSQGMIYDILQDRSGFLWFATKDGLNRYDGYQFRIWQNDPFNAFSISDNDVQALFEDHLGRIWVGTAGNGVNVFEPWSNRFYHLTTLSHQVVNCLAETADGAIWVGTQSGLNRVKIPDELPENDQNLAKIANVTTVFLENTENQRAQQSEIFNLNVTLDDKLWVTAYQQIGFFEAGNTHFTTIASDKKNSNAGIVGFFQTPDSTIWLAQTHQILAFRDNQLFRYPIANQYPSNSPSIAMDVEGNLFFGFQKQILMLPKSQNGAEKRAEKKTFQVFHQFPVSGIIGSTRLFFDRLGILWIGTNGYGLLKYNPGNRQFQHFLSGLSMRNVFTDAQNHVWVWQKYRLSKLDEVANKLRENTFFSPKTPHYCGFLNKKQEIWTISENPQMPSSSTLLEKFDGMVAQKKAQYKIPISSDIYARITEDHNGNLLFYSSESELIRFDPFRESYRVFDFSGISGFKEQAYALVEAIDGIIWIGTPHGLLRATPSGDTLNFYLFKNNPADLQSLKNNFILALLDDPIAPEKWLWVATKGGGLHLLDKKTGHFRHFTTANGLPNNVVYSILPESSGALWVSTNSGLSKFDPKTELFQNFSVSDGLQDNEFNAVSFAKSGDGRLFFGGVNGLTAFFPEKLTATNIAPKVLITALKIQNHLALPGDGVLEKSIENSSSIVLSHAQNQLTFEFAAIDFATPKKNQYRYRLSGVNQDWVEATTANSANYANLAPGNYVFEVISGGSHGVWNGTPARLEIRILSPWYRTFWAFLGYFMAFLAAIWAFYRFQVNKIRLQNVVIFNKKEADRLSELDRLKTNFFSSVTHEFRTPLTLLLEPTRQLLAEKMESPTRFRLQLIEKNAHRLLNFVNQLLDLSKLEAGQMPLELTFFSPVNQLREWVNLWALSAQKKEISLKIETPASEEKIGLDLEKLEQVMVNLLSNALKFTPIGGEIAVSLQFLEQKHLQIQVSDNGIGIAPHDLPHVFDRFFQVEHLNGSTGIGLSLSKELVARMGGTIALESELNAGTTFTVTLPITRQVDFQPIFEPAQQANKQHFLNETYEISLEKAPFSTKNEQKPHILLIEDDVDMRQFLAMSLENKYEITVAENGKIGVEMALEFLPDLILSDIMMPGLDGFGVVDALKKDVRTSHIPIILLTAKSASKMRIEGLQRGADLYLSKPFQTEELFAYLENLLQSRRHLQQIFSKTTESHTIQASVATVFEPVENEFLGKLIAVIEANMDNDQMDAATFARAVFMSRSQLHRKLTALTGLSLTEFVRNCRLDRAHQLLQQGAGNVSEIASQTGFGNTKYFSTCFQKRFGKSPREIRL